MVDEGGGTSLKLMNDNGVVVECNNGFFIFYDVDRSF